jgi:hypothetical protein
MSPILIVLAVLGGVWITATLLAVCLCRIASRGDALRAASLAGPLGRRDPSLRSVSPDRSSRIAA